MSGGIVKEVGAALVFTFRYSVSNDSNSGGTFSAGAIVAGHFNY